MLFDCISLLVPDGNRAIDCCQLATTDPVTRAHPGVVFVRFSIHGLTLVPSHSCHFLFA
jgi:hypothetical protein